MDIGSTILPTTSVPLTADSESLLWLSCYCSPDRPVPPSRQTACIIPGPQTPWTVLLRSSMQAPALSVPNLKGDRQASFASLVTTVSPPAPPPLTWMDGQLLQREFLFFMHWHETRPPSRPPSRAPLLNGAGPGMGCGVGYSTVAHHCLCLGGICPAWPM